MQDTFELTPELLLEQSQEMLSLCSAYDSLFSGISSDLQGMNGSWSDFLANNFSGKIASAQKAFSGTLTMLRNSADSARTVAETARETDALWASKIGGSSLMTGGTDVSSHLLGNDIVVYDRVDIEGYCDKVSDAEYAKLCQLWQEADRSAAHLGDRSMAETFAALLGNALPENDPLRKISPEQMKVVTSPSGFSAVTIQNGDHALVIFAGTDFSRMNDVAADADIVLGIDTQQAKEAQELVNNLSKECSNIIVTGHSLGGYLATAGALDNKAVKQCIAFDPPGRKDTSWQLVSNLGQYSKVRTYEAIGSVVSSNLYGNKGVGLVIPIRVSQKDNVASHLIGQICDALGGEKKIAETWA